MVTAVVVGIAPRIWSTANAHAELPVTLPPFQPLAQRSYVYDSLGNEISVFELENSQPIALSQVPQSVIDAFLAVEDRDRRDAHHRPASIGADQHVERRAFDRPRDLELGGHREPLAGIG